MIGKAVAVSVVIPVFNPGPVLEDLLQSLATQEFAERWEVIVADNGSTDGALALARSWVDELPQLVIVDASDRRGGAHARNVGVAAASAAKLCFLDQDDEAAPGYLHAMAAALDADDFVAARLDHDTLNANWVATALEHWQTERLMNAWGFLPYANFGSLGIRRATWDAVGGADEDLHHSDDVAFCWSVQLAGTKLVFAPDAVVRFRHRRGARGYFRQEWVSGLEDFTLYGRFGSRGMPYPAPGFGTSRAALLRDVLGVRDRRAALRIGGDITRRVARWRAARGRHDDALK